MANYVPDILANFPKSEENRELIFDHFVDDATCRSTGTWPLDLVELINKHSTPNLGRTIVKRKSLALDALSMEDKRKFNLGNKMKTVANEVRKWVQQFYNKAWVTELPSGYNSLQFLEALRQQMIPVVLHRNAIKSSRGLKNDRAARSTKIDTLYNNALKAVNRKSFLPFGWIPWILGGWPRGEKKALKILMIGTEVNRHKSSFSSRSARRAERTAGAQIGRIAKVPTSSADPAPPAQEKVEVQHRLIMSVDMDMKDKKMKVFKERLALEEKILDNYEKYGWIETRAKEYKEIQEQHFELQLQYHRFLRQYMGEPTTEHVTSVNEDHTSPRRSSSHDSPVSSGASQLVFTEETPTQLDPTQMDDQMDTKESDLDTYISEEYLAECVKQQGVILKGIAFEEDVDEFAPTPFKCSVRSCKKYVYDKCVMCRGQYEFCSDHFYHCYHEHENLLN